MFDILSPELRPLLSGPDALVADAAEGLCNPDWDAARARILIVRLSPFKDVDRSSPHLVLFSECRAALPGAFIDFAFFPDKQDREILSARGLPWYYGLASGRFPGSFDLAMVSLSFSLEIINLPYFFSTSGLASFASGRAAARAAGVPSPIVILGGSSAAAAGALLVGSDDAVVDGFFFGEGEGAIGDLATTLSDRDAPVAERLGRAGCIEGFWMPGAGAIPARRVARSSPKPLIDYPILNSDEASTARLQISAGCPGLCSFCLEGWDRRPYRELPLDETIRAARDLRAATGADTLEVYSFNFNTHADIFGLLFELNRVYRRVNLMSQRVDALVHTRGLVDAELAADKRSFTLGIEGISRRMRAYYRKGLADDDIDAAIEALLARGIRELKLFYIISGFENEGDMDAFAAFAAALAAKRRASAPGSRILVSAGYLVRLPSTPLQYAPLALDEALLSRIAASMRASCESNGMEFRLASHFDEYCVDQVLSLGPSLLSAWLVEAPSRGHCYDGSLSRGAWPSLEAFAKKKAILDAAFLGEKGADWAPPLATWNGATLRRHYEAAKRFVDRPPCLGTGCSDCGACDEAEECRFITGHATHPLPIPDYIGRLTRLMATKSTFPVVYAKVVLPESLAGSTDAYRSSWIMRRLSAAAPGVESVLFEAREILFSRAPLDGMLGGAFTGACVFALSGPVPDRIRKAAVATGFAPLDTVPRPGRIELEVRIPSPWSGEALAALRAWLSEERVGFVETRTGDGRRLAPSARDARKHILFEAEVVEGPPCLVRLTLGAKARIGDWLGRLGTRARKAATVRVVNYR